MDKADAVFEVRSFTPAITFLNKLYEAKFTKRGLWPQHPVRDASGGQQKVELRAYGNGSKQFVSTYEPSTGRGLLRLLDPQYTLGSVQPGRVREIDGYTQLAPILGDPSLSVGYGRLVAKSLKYRRCGEIIILKFGLFDDREFGYSVLSDSEVID